MGKETGLDGAKADSEGLETGAQTSPSGADGSHLVDGRDRIRTGLDGNRGERNITGTTERPQYLRNWLSCDTRSQGPS